MLETTFSVDKPSNGQGRRIQLITAILPVLIIGCVVGSLAGLQWSALRGITLGYPMPQVQIAELSTNTLIRNQSYSFSANGIGRELSYSWSFGDQNVGSGAHTSHTYQSNGNFMMEVIVTDPAGHRATQSKMMTVIPPAPYAFFTYAPIYYYSPGYIAFDASNSTADPSTAIVSYSWNFGDGTSDATTYSQETHNYSTVGTYQVMLIVVDATGQTSNPYNVTIIVS